MAWQNPKTDWAVNPKNPVPEDFNRIEGNIDFLKSDIETKKGVIVAAINDMNQPAEVTDSHAQLADKIRDISNDATAVVGDVESGKTFYSAGAKKTGTLALSGTAGTGDVLSGKTFYNTALKTKRTGTMPNQGAAVITPGTSNKAIVAGYHNGQGYVKGDANLKAANIKKGVSIFGVSGTVNTTAQATGSFKAVTEGDGYPYTDELDVPETRSKIMEQTASVSVPMTRGGIICAVASCSCAFTGSALSLKLIIDGVTVASASVQREVLLTLAASRAVSSGTRSVKAVAYHGNGSDLRGDYIFGPSVGATGVYV
jgi:hypothetical protein